MGDSDQIEDQGAADASLPAPRVGFFVTCLVDAMRPSIGFACLSLLQEAGCQVEVPATQTCCGQPGYNSGADDLARSIARGVIDAFLPFDYLVAPSGSCAGMIKGHYPELFAEDPVYADKSRRLADKTYEILGFLHDVMGYRPKGARYQGVATYHDSCSGLRELNVHDQPRALLGAVEGLSLVPLEGSESCCGFGGTFCAKYPDISNAIVTDKARAIEASGADTLLAGDLGCLMNMAGKLSRMGSKVKAYHTVEVLAGMADAAPLCAPEKR